MADLEEKAQFEQLLHAINHDLRSPLANIRSATSILLHDLNDPLTDDQRAFIDIIEKAIIRLLAQSNQLMLLNQVAFSTSASEPTQLSNLLACVKKELKNAYDIDTIHFIYEDDLQIDCQEHTIGIMLSLLAAGDTKHRPSTPLVSPPTIRVQTRPDRLCFIISGPLPTHELSFSLVALSQAIVQQHGSQLEIDDVDGRKQYSFCLPRTLPAD